MFTWHDRSFVHFQVYSRITNHSLTVSHSSMSKKVFFTLWLFSLKPKCFSALCITVTAALLVCNSFNIIWNPLVYDLSETVLIHLFMRKKKAALIEVWSKLCQCVIVSRCFDIRTKWSRDVIILHLLSLLSSQQPSSGGAHSGSVDKNMWRSNCSRKTFKL